MQTQLSNLLFTFLLGSYLIIHVTAVFECLRPSVHFSSNKHINLLILRSFDSHQQKQAIESASRLHHKQLIASNIPYEKTICAHCLPQFSCMLTHTPHATDLFRFSCGAPYASVLRVVNRLPILGQIDSSIIFDRLSKRTILLIMRIF